MAWSALHLRQPDAYGRENSGGHTLYVGLNVVYSYAEVVYDLPATGWGSLPFVTLICSFLIGF